MFWLIKATFKLTLRVQLLSMAALAGMAAGFFLILRDEQRTWAVSPRDVTRELPGDDLVPVPDVVETRSLHIDAAPEAVWPWLAQMGWGRGGWYSYDRMDMAGHSADTILEEFGELAEGDLVPTHPGGGFVAKLVEPGEALVLYLDTELVSSQMEAVGEDVADEIAEAVEEESLPGGLAVAGTMGDMAMPEFKATWAFQLVPDSDGTTRLVERFRVWSAEAGVPQQLSMPFMGLGVFIMTRKHMLGVKERAERPATDDLPASAA